MDAKANRRGERRIVVGLVAAFAVLVLAALLLLGAASDQEKTTRWVAGSQAFATAVDRLVSALSDTENGRRGYVISGSARYLGHYTNGLHHVEQAIHAINELAVADARTATYRRELERLARNRLAIFSNSIVARQIDGFVAAEQTRFIEQGQKAMEPIRRLAAQLDDEEARSVRENMASRQKSTNGAKGLAVLVSLLALGTFVCVLVLLVRANRQRRRAEHELNQLNDALELRVRDRTRELEQARHQVMLVNEDLEKRVTDRTEQLQAANQELEAFSYSVSHDLRAPLRHIQGYAQMLQRAADGHLPDEAARYLKTIIGAGTEMGRLIDDLLEFSRVGRAELHLRPVSLDELVREVLRGMELELRDRSIEWAIEPIPEVMGDVSLLRQVLVNLIGNAVKYSRDRRPARIEISGCFDDNEMVATHIRDNGAGFDMAYVDKLFGVFQRLHRVDEFEGTGIGLATVRQIVHRHGGRTWAEGKVEEGATFHFTLKPATLAQRKPPDTHGESQKNTAGG